MRKNINKRPIILAAAAFVLTGTLAVGSAMAYFTTYATAQGAHQLDIGFTETEVEDEVDSEGKHIAIKNTGDYDCFVRVKVFSAVDLEYQAGAGWEQEADGYWYYRDVLPADSSTSELLAIFEFPKNTEEDKTEEFDIIVIHECAPVVYDDAGIPSVDWNNLISPDSTEQ